MTALINHQVRLNAHPVGMPGPETWRFTTEPIAAPAEGEFLSKVLCISMDPAMRVWLNAGDSYVRHVGLGEVMRASVVATVIASKHPGFSPGDCVAGRLGVEIGLRLPQLVDLSLDCLRIVNLGQLFCHRASHSTAVQKKSGRHVSA